MADNAKHTVATAIPTLRYQDAAAAIEWLCKAFGFEKHLIVPGEDGAIAHGEHYAIEPLSIFQRPMRGSVQIL